MAGGAEYLSVFAEAGVKTLADVAGQSESDFAKIGVKKMKVRKLLAKALREYEAETAGVKTELRAAR
eukprot:SAG31_NODE_12763_length_918_cov_1.732601_1_plen_66_part_10